MNQGTSNLPILLGVTGGLLVSSTCLSILNINQTVFIILLCKPYYLVGQESSAWSHSSVYLAIRGFFYMNSNMSLAS